MDTYGFYAYSSSAWLAIQGLPLLIYARSITSLLFSHSQKQTTEFELYSIRAMGGFFLAVSVASLLISIRPPPSQRPSPNDAPTPLTSGTQSAAPPLSTIVLPLTTGLHAMIAMYSYSRHMNMDPEQPWMVYLVVSTFLTCLGGGAMLFGDETRPERGSRWPFESAEKRAERKAALKEKASKIL